MADTHYGNLDRQIRDYSSNPISLDRVAQGTGDLLNRAYVSGISGIVPSFRKFYDSNPLKGNATLLAGALSLAFLGSYVMDRIHHNPSYQPVVTREVPVQRRTLDDALVGQERVDPLAITPSGSAQMTPEMRESLKEMNASFRNIHN